jgi:uncharacterized protein (DUF433 family)
MARNEWLQRIEVNHQVMVGKPIIKGTRVPVYMLVKMVGQGISEEEILRAYPRIVREDIHAALLYAAAVLENEDVFPQLAQA